MKLFYKIRRIKHTVFVVFGFKISIRNKSAADYDFIMTDKERKCFEKYVLKSKRYLEFGIGGSTIFYLRNSSGKMCCVESRNEWLDFMRKKNVIVKQEAKGYLKIFDVDIGPIKEWGYPLNENSREKFPNYSKAVFETSDDKYDLILVNGRFKVACVLASLIHQRKYNPVIAIHDFETRENYHVVLKYLNVIEKADTLGIFRIKKDVNDEELIAEYENFKYDVE